MEICKGSVLDELRKQFKVQPDLFVAGEVTTSDPVSTGQQENVVFFISPVSPLYTPIKLNNWMIGLKTKINSMYIAEKDRRFLYSGSNVSIKTANRAFDFSWLFYDEALSVVGSENTEITNWQENLLEAAGIPHTVTKRTGMRNEIEGRLFERKIIVISYPDNDLAKWAMEYSQYMEEVKRQVPLTLQPPKHSWVYGISARDLRGHRIRRQHPNLLGEVIARLTW